MDILLLPAELLAEPALPGGEETARYAVGAGGTGSLDPQQLALVQRRRKEIGLHADASSGWGALIRTAVSVWRPLASVLFARGDGHLGISHE
jgi:hypothetical protein